MKNLIRSISILVFILVILSYRESTLTIWMIGDSTMSVKQPDKRPETGWGMPFATMFDSRVTIKNRAMNGRSTKTFLSENRWAAILDSIQEGDYVFIQFGHNDESKEKVDRYTTPDEYKANLIKFVQEARSKKGIPVLLTPVVRRRFDSLNRFYDVHGVYPDKVRAVASEYNVLLIDMQKLSEQLLISLGNEESIKLFNHLNSGEHPNYPNGIKDDTHFNEQGATRMAELVRKDITDQQLPLAAYFKQ